MVDCWFDRHKCKARAMLNVCGPAWKKLGRHRATGQWRVEGMVAAPENLDGEFTCSMRFNFAFVFYDYVITAQALH